MWKDRRVVLVRNSWGEAWGQSGQAWLSEMFLKPRVFRLAILTENVDVSAPVAAA